MTDDRYRRRPKRAGRTSGKRLAECRHCRKPPLPPRRTFCSDECVHEWKLVTNPRYQADHVLKRDDGICALCRLDCIAFGLDARLRRRRDSLADFDAWADEVGLSPRRRGTLSRRFWEVDHIVPIVEGGGSCGLAGLRTLCWRCHIAQTRQLRTRRSLGARTGADPGVG